MTSGLTSLINGRLDGSSFSITFGLFDSTVLVLTFMIETAWFSIFLRLSTLVFTVTVSTLTLHSLITSFSFLISCLSSLTLESAGFIIFSTRLSTFGSNHTLVGKNELRSSRSVSIHGLLYTVSDSDQSQQICEVHLEFNRVVHLDFIHVEVQSIFIVLRHTVGIDRTMHELASQNLHLHTGRGSLTDIDARH